MGFTWWACKLNILKHIKSLEWLKRKCAIFILWADSDIQEIIIYFSIIFVFSEALMFLPTVRTFISFEPFDVNHHFLMLDPKRP